MRLPLSFCLLCLCALPMRAEDIRTTVLAGGCFWCVESDFDRVEGVLETISGYTGGNVENPTYKQVVRGRTGHAEAVQITYDADVVSYRRLLELYWRSVDPTDAGGQFCDRGDSYRTEVYVQNAEERAVAEATRREAAEVLDAPVVTEIVDLTAFYPAEEYHQNFYLKSPVRYKTYRKGCGRDARIMSIWGDEAVFADHS